MSAFAVRLRVGLRVVFALATTAAVLVLAHPAWAQIDSERYSSVVIDAATGDILSAVSIDEPRFPASLTKMMTLYMLFEALRDRRIGLDDAVPVSERAAAMPPSRLGLSPGMYLTVEQALLGLVTKSANDAAAALGEMMGGDEDRFAQMMTLRARALGMTHTTFRNASGLPDWDQVTTARDLAVLARHLVADFPVQYRYFSTPGFIFHGRTVLNHDRMLQTYPGADGMKTGYTEAAGHNLVTSAVRGGTRLIGVITGAASNSERDWHMAGLLDRGFEQLGVPVSMAQDLPLPFRMPSLIASAQAAPMRSYGRFYSGRIGLSHTNLSHLARARLLGRGSMPAQLALHAHEPQHRAEEPRAGRSHLRPVVMSATLRRNFAGFSASHAHEAGPRVMRQPISHSFNGRSTLRFRG